MYGIVKFLAIFSHQIEFIALNNIGIVDNDTNRLLRMFYKIIILIRTKYFDKIQKPYQHSFLPKRSINVNIYSKIISLTRHVSIIRSKTIN